MRFEGAKQIISTLPVDCRGQGSVNLGMKIVSEKLSLEEIGYRDKIKDCDVILFNIIYPTHIFNMISALHRNNIPIFSRDRTVKVGIGGPASSLFENRLTDIVDNVFRGEIEGYFEENIDKHGYYRATNIDSKPVVYGPKAMIELTRGCRFSCAFCEYGCDTGGPYREKPFELVMEQINELNGVKAINFLSANFGAYGSILSLLECCAKKNIRVLNTDIALKDLEKTLPYLKSVRITSLKIGVESFDEPTRKKIGKTITDEKLFYLISKAIETCSYLHFYLIYGLPDDNYDNWFRCIKELGKLRLSITDRPLRFEFSITNFEPCARLKDAPLVDFEQKDAFLLKWVDALKDAGFYKKDKKVTYGNCRGRHGRKEPSYNLLMSLRNDDNIQDAVAFSYKSGVSRTISDKKCDRYLSLLSSNNIDVGVE